MTRKKFIHCYLYNIIIAVSQLVNAALGGQPDETLSSRMGRVKRSHGGSFPSHMKLARFLDWFLDKIDKDHFWTSIKEPTRERELWDWEKKR